MEINVELKIRNKYQRLIRIPKMWFKQWKLLNHVKLGEKIRFLLSSAKIVLKVKNDNPFEQSIFKKRKPILPLHVYRFPYKSIVERLTPVMHPAKQYLFKKIKRYLNNIISKLN